MQNEHQRYADNEAKYKSLRDDYKTPPEIYKPILEIFGASKFDLDVACTEHNIPARFYFTKESDGLLHDWFGLCFCNPPWKKTIKFIKHAAKQHNATICFVIASDRFYVDYMQEFVINNPCAVFLILPKKQGFIIPSQKNKTPVPSVGTSIVIICESVQEAEKIKNNINYRNLFNTTAFRGGGIYENLVHYNET